MAVSDSERKIDKLKKDNEELRLRLHELAIDTGADTQASSSPSRGGESSNGGVSSSMDEEIIEMNSTLNN